MMLNVASVEQWQALVHGLTQLNERKVNWSESHQFVGYG